MTMTDIKKLKYYINSQEKMINAIVSYLNGGMRNDLGKLRTCKNCKKWE